MTFVLQFVCLFVCLFVFLFVLCMLESIYNSFSSLTERKVYRMSFCVCVYFVFMFFLSC